MQGVVRLMLLALAVTLAQAHVAAAIEELEAEENISDLLPTQFPSEAPEHEVAERPWALLPQFGFGPDTGVVLGAKFAHRDVYATGTTLDIDGTYALKGQESLAVSIGSPHLLDDRLVLLLRARFHDDPQREFFGLGNNEVGPDPVSTHEFQDLGTAFTVGWRPFERVAFNFSFGFRKVDVRRGERKDDVPFTVDAFPDLPGVHGGKVNPIALSLVWNTRDDVMRPTHGWRLILKAIHTDRTLLSDFDFTRYLFDAGYLRAFWDGAQIFGVRVNGEWIDSPPSEVPFWELSELGGEDSLRGFFPHRFVGRGRLLINGEWRSRLTEFQFYRMWRVRLDGVLFGDGGRVFIDRTDLKDEFKLNSHILSNIVDNFQYSYGFGLRLALSQALVARLDVGFSNEETGLVYLSFGHTF